MSIPSLLRYRFQRAHLFRRLLSTATEEKIVIPNRIPRGPTDILRALESTLQKDPTAAHYKYHDDPYLLPMNNLAKRSYAMAQESGRKAAHWVRSENAELFNHSECDPPIESFYPRIVFNENSKVTEQDLINVIERNQVADAILVNNLLQTKGETITDQTKQNLLELLCYNNSEDFLNEEFIEERWFRQSSSFKEKQRKTWKDGSVADDLFASLENPTAEAYATIIQGMAKFNQAARAYHYFEEAGQKQLALNVDTYNALIRVAMFLKEGYDLRWGFVLDMLQQIKQAGLKPNLGTLNSVLYTLSTMGNSRQVKDFTLKVLKEFKELGVNPSLGSWYYILITFCKDRGPKNDILSSILNEIADKSHEIRDISDTNFFVTAMDVACTHLNDVQLGQKLHNLLLFGHNYNLIGDSYKESIYYRHYFRLLLSNVPLDEFIEKTYRHLVPNIYVPEPTVMRDLLTQIDLNAALDYIPQIWSDMIIFGHNNREDLINHVLGVMTDNEPPKESDLIGQFGNIAWDIYTTVDEQNEDRYNLIKFTGEMLGKILTLVLRGGDFEQACKVMDKLDKEHNTIVGVPTFDALSLFVDHCIENKVPSRAIKCIQYASDSGFPDALSLGARLNEKLTLDENHLNQLSKCIDLKLL